MCRKGLRVGAQKLVKLCTAAAHRLSVVQWWGACCGKKDRCLDLTVVPRLTTAAQKLGCCMTPGLGYKPPCLLACPSLVFSLHQMMK